MSHRSGSMTWQARAMIVLAVAAVVLAVLFVIEVSHPYKPAKIESTSLGALRAGV